MAATVRDYEANKEGTKEVELAVPLKYLSNFWRTLDMPLINCEVSLALSWSATCVITSLENRLVTTAQGDNPAVYDDFPTDRFKLTDTKSYVTVVTLSAENEKKKKYKNMSYKIMFPDDKYQKISFLKKCGTLYSLLEDLVTRKLIKHLS